MNSEVIDMRKVFVGMLACLLITLLVANTLDAAKKVNLYPYKVVLVNGRTGGAVDSVIKPLDNDISDPLAKAAQGIYECTFDPAHGDSSTNGVDSLTTGLHYDSVQVYFDISDYDGGWLGYGLYDWDSTAGNADVDSHRIEVNVQLGTEMGNSGVFYPFRSMAIQDRGADSDHLDTIVCCMESLYVVPFNFDVEGGVEADSTLFLDKLRITYQVADSALVGDAVNTKSIWFRAYILAKEEY
jgi:hypothetical protein